MTAGADAGRPAFRRIVLKLSGEALAGSQGYGIDPPVLDRIGEEIREVVDLGVQMAIVIGGGNIFRGVAASAAAVSVVKNGLPVPAPKITTRPFSRWRIARRRM